MGNKAPSKTTTTNKFEMSPEQRRLLEPTIPIALNYLKNPPKLPGYSQIAGFNPNQTAAQNMLLGQVVPGQQEFAGNIQDANQFLLSPDILDPNTNPALAQWMQAATRPLEQSLMETVLPGVRGEAITAGQFGGSRQGIAEGLATGRTMQAMGDVSANIANQGYQSGLDAMARGLALSPQTMQAMAQPALTQGAVGDVQRNMEQMLLQEQWYKDMYAQMAPFLAAQEVAAMAQGFPGGTSTATMTGGQPSGGGIGGALSGGMGGLSLAAGLGATGPWGLGIGALLGGLAGLF